jgi:hypothetical protein
MNNILYQGKRKKKPPRHAEFISASHIQVNTG